MPHLDERVTPSEWTVLLYTGPSLAQQDQKLIDELLRQVAPSPNVCFVYQLNSYDRSVRGAITKDRSISHFSESPPVDVSEPAELTAFVDWAQALCPSRSTMLVLKDHGTGWGPPGAVRMTDILYYGGRYMSTPGVRTAVEQTKSGHIDIYGFDSCSMSTLEVAYEVRDVASFFVGTPASAYTGGWPYRAILDLLQGERGWLCPRDLTKRLIPLLKGTATAPYAGVELSWMENIKEAIDGAAQEILPLVASGGPAPPQGNDGGNAYDVLALFHYLRSFYDPPQSQAFDALDKYLAAAVVAPHIKPDSVTGGLSIFFPTATGSSALASYGSVSFARKNHWTEYISRLNQWYLQGRAEGFSTASDQATPLDRRRG